MRVYDKPLDGTLWPKWWEEDYDPDTFGSVCALCLREITVEENDLNAPGLDQDLEMEVGSCFCVCRRCVTRYGRRPSYNNIDRHDRAVIQRFDAVYRQLKAEIKNGNGRAQGWRSIGALQSGWAHYGHHQ